MTTIVNGLVGGLVCALVATGALRLLADRVSLFDALGHDDGDAESGARLVEGAVSLLYGLAAGGCLVALELSVLDLLAIPPSQAETLGLALAWAAVLAAVLIGVRWVSPDGIVDATAGELLAFHLVYGVSLGLWIRLTWIT